MSSIIKAAECPNCNSNNCSQEHWNKNGECSRFCENCGYEETVWVKTDDNGEIVLLKSELGLDFGNVIIKDSDVVIPYGAATIAFIKKHKVVTQLHTNEHYKRFKKQYCDLNKIDKDVKEVTVRRYVSGELIEEPLFKRYNYESSS